MAISSDLSNIPSRVSNIKQGEPYRGAEESHFLNSPETISLRKASGYFLLVLSCLGWGAFFTLPLFEISVGEATAFTIGLIVGSETAFLLGIALLGKEVWGKIKAIFRKCLNRFLRFR